MRSSIKRSAGDDAGASPCKRGRPKGSVLLSRYRVDGDFADSATNERNKKALEKELERDHPRKDNVLSLMKQTYSSGREEILTGSVDISVTELLTTYPALCLPYSVSG